MSLITTPGFWSSASNESFLGCIDEAMDQDRLREWVVRVFFPNMEEVFVGSEFNRWSVPGLPMKQIAAHVWETKLAIPRPSGNAGCFGFIRGRLAQVRYFPLGTVKLLKSSLVQPEFSSSFHVLHHDVV